MYLNLFEHKYNIQIQLIDEINKEDINLSNDLLNNFAEGDFEISEFNKLLLTNIYKSW